LKFSAVIDPDALYKEAEEALSALESVLGGNKWFFEAKLPGLFDASVFAYTHLLMDETLGNGWVDMRLCSLVKQRKSLVAHRNRVLTTYFK
jgi:metaxin